ncbi:MAG: hypothetical protein P8189_23735 [Anaerolineae bacterium]
MRGWLLILSSVLLRLAWPSTALAHVGAPYPVLLEEPVGPYLASALADPDVGKGTFYILVTLAGGEAPAPDTAITVWVEPEDGHLAEAGYPAERQETRYGERFVAEVPFDAEGAWQVRLVLEGPAGRGETAFPVRVTPSGVGWLATLGCLVPFVILGGLWLRGALRSRESSGIRGSGSSGSSPPADESAG